MRCGACIVILSMTPVRHSTSSSATTPPTTSARYQDTRLIAAPAAPPAVRPIVFSDSSRSVFHSRAVIAPNSACSMIRLSRSRGQRVSTTSTIRPGRADITPIRSASIVASSSACVMRKTVASVSRHIRSSSSPISRRVCWSSAPKGSSSRISRGCITSVRAMHTRWRMPPESCAG